MRPCDSNIGIDSFTPDQIADVNIDVSVSLAMLNQSTSCLLVGVSEADSWPMDRDGEIIKIALGTRPAQSLQVAGIPT
jgi:hypothetical protein